MAPRPFWGATDSGRGWAPAEFGTVYAAVDERLDRDVAAKVIPAGAPAPERASRRGALDHPGIVAVFDARPGTPRPATSSSV